MPTFDEPAKGRKKCPSCGVYVQGLRSVHCDCGYNFKLNKLEKVATAPRKVVTPAPVTEEDDVDVDADAEVSAQEFAAFRRRIANLDLSKVIETKEVEKPEQVTKHVTRTTYDVPGPGRKQCPSCEKYVWVKSSTCSNPGCSYDFKANPPPPKVKAVKPPKVAQPFVPFDGPGRGRRLCPGCENYISVIHAVCPNPTCSYDFKANPPVPKLPIPKVVVPPSTYDTPGRGRKQCSCGIYVGAVVSMCPACGSTFEPKQPKQPKQPKPTTPANVSMETEASVVGEASVMTEDRGPVLKSRVSLRPNRYVNSDKSLYLVSTPAGECPVKLKGTEVEQVAEWADAVMEHFARQHRSLAIEGLIYFAGTIHNFWTSEFKIIESHIEQLFAN